MIKSQGHRNGEMHSLDHASVIDPNKTQSQVINFLRVLAILAVLLIHTTTRHLETVHMDLPRHQITLFLNQVARFAVPSFFMISGYVLELNYRPGYIAYLKRRLSRLFVPYIFWSVIYYYFVYTTHHSVNFFSALFTGNSSYQLYFIPSLLLFYLVFPLLRRLNTLPVLLSLFVFQVYILNLDYHLNFPSIPYPLAVAAFNFFPFIFGIYLSSRKIFRLYPIIYMLGLFYLANVIFKEGYLGYQKSWNIHYFYSQWRPSILLYSLAVFLILYSIKEKIHKVPYLGLFSRLSFFVFFIHVIVLELVWKYLGMYIYQYPGFDLFYFSIVVSISFLLAYGIHRLPYFSALTG